MATGAGKVLGEGIDTGIDLGKGLFRKLIGGAPQEGLQPTTLRRGADTLLARDKSGLGRLGAGAWRFGKYVGLPLTGAGALYGLGRMAFGGGDQQGVDYKQLMKDIEARNAASSKEEEAAFEAYLSAITGAGAGGGGGGGGGGMSASDYNYLAGLSNQAGGASLAAMQDLANQYGQTATGIRAGGEAGAQALRDIYGAAAADIKQGSRLAGTAGSGLVPVSGAMAQLPADINRAGGSMADYLAQNELINAQSAGFLSNLSNELGRGYAQQVARQDQTFRMAQAAADRRAAAAAASRNSEIQREADITAAQLRYERLLNRGAKPKTGPADLAMAVGGYKGLDSETKKAFKEAGITNAQEYALYILGQPQTAE